MVGEWISWSHAFFILALLLCVVIFCLIFYSVIRYRHDKNHSKSLFHASAWKEYLWLGLSLLMCFLLMAPALWVWFFYGS